MFGVAQHPDRSGLHENLQITSSHIFEMMAGPCFSVEHHEAVQLLNIQNIIVEFDGANALNG